MKVLERGGSWGSCWFTCLSELTGKQMTSQITIYHKFLLHDGASPARTHHLRSMILFLIFHDIMNTQLSHHLCFQKRQPRKTCLVTAHLIYHNHFSKRCTHEYFTFVFLLKCIQVVNGSPLLELLITHSLSCLYRGNIFLLLSFGIYSCLVILRITSSGFLNIALCLLNICCCFFNLFVLLPFCDPLLEYIFSIS